MNLQQVPLPKSSSNGFGRRRGGERDKGTSVEHKLMSGKSNPGRIPNAAGGPVGGYESPRDCLMYLAVCLIGHPVEVHMKNGSVYTGIFHATDGEKDFGILLNMARLIRDGTVRGEKAMADFVSKAPLKTLIIPGKDLVQILAKDVSVTRDDFASELQREKQLEIMTDSAISHSRYVDVERELEPWVPDEDDLQHPELDNIFDGPWNRNWDQFETNKLLFGVKSTFNEELYTTKLERGPQTRGLEKEAMRIAREIEGEDTQDLHLAEERGVHLYDKFDIDEETRFSSVYRGKGFDDSGYEEDEEILLDSHNVETFGTSSTSISNRPATFTSSKSSGRAVVPSSSSFMDDEPSSLSTSGVDLNRFGSGDLAKQLASELPFRSTSDSESRIQNGLLDDYGSSGDAKDPLEKQVLNEVSNSSIFVDSQPLIIDKTGSANKARLSANSTSIAVQASSKSDEKPSLKEDSEGPASRKATGEAQSVISRSSTLSNSDRVRAAPASSGIGLSPSSSMGSLSSEKSSLNPFAKEFKLNPNAKSFSPSQTTARPPSPVSDGSFYYPPTVSPVSHMHSMAGGFGMGPSFPGHQPVMFNPAGAPMQSPQAYYHPNGPQYGQQMLLGQPRQVVFMPNYQPEMQYKGRDY